VALEARGSGASGAPPRPGRRDRLCCESMVILSGYVGASVRAASRRC
jgi:hypothetical protein